MALFLIPLALGLTTAAGAYAGYRTFAEPKKAVPTPMPPSVFVDPKNMPGLVKELQKGKVYTVIFVFDWKKIPGSESAAGDSATVRARMSDYLRTVWGGGPGAATPTGLGFAVLSPPATLNEEETQKFNAGKLSSWAFTGRWLNDTPDVKVPSDLLPILPNATFYLLPSM